MFVSPHLHTTWLNLTDLSSKANPRLADRRDDDDRLPLHWAVSYNHLGVVELLAQTKNFDPDVQVRTQCVEKKSNMLSSGLGLHWVLHIGWVGLDTIDDRIESQRSR